MAEEKSITESSPVNTDLGSDDWGQYLLVALAIITVIVIVAIIVTMRLRKKSQLNGSIDDRKTVY